MGVPFDLDQDQDTHVSEICGGDDCNGYADYIDVGRAEAGWLVGDEADAAVYHAPLREESGVSNLLFTILIPLAAR